MTLSYRVVNFGLFLASVVGMRFAYTASPMIRARAVLAILVLAPVFFAASVRSAEQTLIAPGAVWKYNDTNTNLGTAWRGSSYNDAAWTAV